MKNVRHPQHRRRMQHHRMLHQPANGEFDRSRGPSQHQRRQPGPGQNTPFGQLLQQMRQQRQHQEHGQHHLRQQQQHGFRNVNGANDAIQGAHHQHRHQQHRMRAMEPKEMGNQVDDQLNSLVHHTPRRPMHRQWLRNHPSKFPFESPWPESHVTTVSCPLPVTLLVPLLLLSFPDQALRHYSSWDGNNREAHKN